MKVLKFGGSSLGSPELIHRVMEIVGQQAGECVLVVSAFHNVTDQLVSLCNMAANSNERYIVLLEDLATRHIETVRNLNIKGDKKSILDHVAKSFKEISNVLHGSFLLGDITPKVRDMVLAFGERMSGYIISHLLPNAVYVDARDLIKTNNNHENARVNLELTAANIKQRLSNTGFVPVVPGFIASTETGETTTLGRGGSDYTAALIASVLDAEELQIWTDVDGFMTADPRKVRKAIAIEELSYAEAMELSHFGAKVVYTPTIQPVYQSNIPVVIKNTFNPKAKGTLISKEPGHSPNRLIKGISSIDDITLITVQGAGMVGTRGMSGRMFTALAQQEVNIILITQASSEYSITFAITPADKELALRALNQAFEHELKASENIFIRVEEQLSVIAIVGEGILRFAHPQALEDATAAQRLVNLLRHDLTRLLPPELSSVYYCPLTAPFPVNRRADAIVQEVLAERGITTITSAFVGATGAFITVSPLLQLGALVAQHGAGLLLATSPHGHIALVMLHPAPA
ncbi:MAG: aspartate kinase [Bacteroidales bacterium]|nr:aspartate kinase [Bacteroidales bacterium]